MITPLRNPMFCIKGGVRGSKEKEDISIIQRIKYRFSFTFSCKDIGFMTIPLIALNLVDALLSFYAQNVLGFMELNPLAVGFPIWILVLKFGVCFIPLVCAYMFVKFGMNNYLLLPFVCSVILMDFYAFVVAFNISSILGV